MTRRKYDFAGDNQNAKPSKINEIICILDASSSMHAQRESTIAGFNDFLSKQKKSLKKNTKTLLTVVTFNSQTRYETYETPTITYQHFFPAQLQPWEVQINRIPNSIARPPRLQQKVHMDEMKLSVMYNRVDIREAKPLTPEQYQCQGCTPLYDSISSVICTSQNTILNDEIKPHSVLVVIMTDGEENTSKTWTGETTRALIESKRASNWNFLFIGAGLDNFQDSYTTGLSDYTIRTNNSGQGYMDAWGVVGDVSLSCSAASNGMYSTGDLSNITMNYTEANKI